MWRLCKIILKCLDFASALNICALYVWLDTSQRISFHRPTGSLYLSLLLFLWRQMRMGCRFPPFHFYLLIVMVLIGGLRILLQPPLSSNSVLISHLPWFSCRTDTYRSFLGRLCFLLRLLYKICIFMFSSFFFACFLRWVTFIVCVILHWHIF